jgi:hypothetical protein
MLAGIDGADQAADRRSACSIGCCLADLLLAGVGVGGTAGCQNCAAQYCTGKNSHVSLLWYLHGIFCLFRPLECSGVHLNFLSLLPRAAVMYSEKPAMPQIA